MKKANLKQHLLAGSLHLLASMLVAAAAMALIFLAWYPKPLAHMMGVDHLLLIMIGVDVVLGPLLTTILYDPAKGKWLLLDLTVIAVLQLGALAYGLHSIYGGRPALIVFNIDRFDAVQASSMDPKSLEIAQAQGHPGLPWLKPRMMAAFLPTDQKEKEDLMFSSMAGGPDITQLAQYQVPYEQAAQAVIGKMRPLEELKGANDLDDAAWKTVLGSLPQPETDLGYLPLKGREVDGSVILDRRSGTIVQFSALQPRWAKGG